MPVLDRDDLPAEVDVVAVLAGAEEVLVGRGVERLVDGATVCRLAEVEADAETLRTIA